MGLPRAGLLAAGLLRAALTLAALLHAALLHVVRDANGVRSSPNESHELVARAVVLEEDAGHRAGDGRGVLLFDAAHRHAEVIGLADDGDTLGLEHLFQAVGDLSCQALLDL